MGRMIELKTSDGATISAYRADPAGKPKAGLVVAQEIFGVNPHIRSVADRFAARGYLAVAPALFDRVKPGVELGYTEKDFPQGIELRAGVTLDQSLADISAAMSIAAEAGKVGIVGYCWGGFLAFMSACRLSDIWAAVAYYGGGIAGHLGETPKAPVLMHFGERDAHITMDDVAKIKQAYPSIPVHTYHADHGFNCDARGSYDKPSADLALQRTLDFFAKNLG